MCCAGNPAPDIGEQGGGWIDNRHRRAISGKL
jgi:hypothetical protein